MIQTLEICNKAVKRKSPSSVTGPDRFSSPSSHFSTSRIVSERDYRDEDDCSDDDSFVSAMSSEKRADEPFVKPFEIGIATRSTPKLSRGSGSCPNFSLSARSAGSSPTYSLGGDDDLVSQIEAMAARVETAFSSRRASKKMKKAYTYEHLPEMITPVALFKEGDRVQNNASLSPDPFQLVKPRSSQLKRELPKLAPFSFGSLSTLGSAESLGSANAACTRNEEWVASAPTNAPSALLQCMKELSL